MSKAIIFTGGGAPCELPVKLQDPEDIVIAADSGYEVAKALGYKVDLCLGDFDSTTMISEIQNLKHETSSRDKDDSDTALALRKAKALGFSSYILIGGGGFRMDHLFSTFSLFETFGPPVAWFTAYEHLYLVPNDYTFEHVTDSATVSFFPSTMCGKVQVTAKQLQWPLVDYPLTMANLSLSNRVVGTTLNVHVTGDALFVCFPVADKLI